MARFEKKYVVVEGTLEYDGSEAYNQEIILCERDSLEEAKDEAVYCVRDRKTVDPAEYADVYEVIDGGFGDVVFSVERCTRYDDDGNVIEPGENTLEV